MMTPPAKGQIGLFLLVLIPAVWLAAQTNQVQPKRVRVSQGVIQRNIIEQPKPKYPKEARDRRIEGQVQIKVVLGTKGKLTQLEVIKGEPILAEAATKAVKKWRYKPYLLNGEPVEVETLITVNFQLHSDKDGGEAKAEH
jgi:protein TonB